MLDKFRTLKTTARIHLRDSYTPMVLSIFLSSIILYLISLPFANPFSYAALRNLSSSENYLPGPMSLFIAFLGNILVSLLSFVVSCGILYMNLKRTKEEKVEIKHLFYPFQHRPDQYIVIYLLMIAVSIVCCIPGCIAFVFSIANNTLPVISILLFLIGAIISVYIFLRWEMAPFLLLESDGSVSAIHALRKSFQITDGQVLSLFLLHLSFIGYYILILFSFGIAAFWVAPYISQTITEFYLSIKA